MQISKDCGGMKFCLLLRHTPLAIAVVLLTAWLAGCASGPTADPARMPAELQLTLPANALGCSLAVQQHLTVQPPGQGAQELDALLEVDAPSVRLALFHLGQRMGTLTWDGQHLHNELSRWWPAQLPPAQVFSDMQLALWPASAIEKALPADWTIIENNSSRRFSYKGVERISVQSSGADAFDIRYAPLAWQLHVASPGGMQPCTSRPEAP